jgi:two-component system, OmpR family, response regulator
MAVRILIVEDDAGLLSMVKWILEEEGYEVVATADGSEAVTTAESFRPHLAVLDVRLPGMDGFTVARCLQDSHEVPVLFLTVADSLQDRLAGFSAGGDDYLTKPFEPVEFLARVRAIIRRTHKSAPRVWRLGDLVVDEGSHEVTRAGSIVGLTAVEFRLLCALLRHRGQVVSKDQLFAAVWGDAYPSANVVEVHISLLRRKLESHGQRLIHTVRNAGYVLRDIDFTSS